MIRDCTFQTNKCSIRVVSSDFLHYKEVRSSLTNDLRRHLNTKFCNCPTKYEYTYTIHFLAYCTLGLWTHLWEIKKFLSLTYKWTLTCPGVVDGIVQLMTHHVHLHPVHHQPGEEQVSLVVDRLLILVGHCAVHQWVRSGRQNCCRLVNRFIQNKFYYYLNFLLIIFLFSSTASHKKLWFDILYPNFNFILINPIPTWIHLFFFQNCIVIKSIVWNFKKLLHPLGEKL